MFHIFLFIQSDGVFELKIFLSYKFNAVSSEKRSENLPD